MVRFARTSIGLAVLLGWTAGAHAQAPQTPAQPTMPQMNMMDHRGAVQGRVRNDADVPFIGATVTAINAETGARFTATTDDQGRYNFAALPVGKYDISIVSNNGLTTFRRTGVEVVEDRSSTLDIAITPVTTAEAAEFE